MSDEPNPAFDVQSYGEPSEADRARARSNPALPRILWLALLVSHFMLAGVAIAVRSSAAPPPPQAAIVPVMPLALAAAALGSLVAIFLVIPRTQAAVHYHVFSLLRWALAESISICGLVLAVLGADWTIVGSFMGVGVATHLYLAPTDRDRERHAALAREASSR